MVNSIYKTMMEDAIGQGSLLEITLVKGAEYYAGGSVPFYSLPESNQASSPNLNPGNTLAGYVVAIDEEKLHLGGLGWDQERNRVLREAQAGVDIHFEVVDSYRKL